jgi:hypothetical protein
MTPPAKVLELIERFERNLDAYKRPDYKEARVRVEFIDPFFEALGWDVHNRQGRGEHDKDVVYEDAIQRQIEATDRQIDALVYELYGLTEQEIGIVERQS